MIRGTTPTFRLEIDDSIDLTTMDSVYATFKQGSLLTTKTGEDIVVEAHEVDVYFSQQDSLKFTEGLLDIQLNWTFEDGKRGCTEIVKIKVGENLEDRVLT